MKMSATMSNGLSFPNIISHKMKFAFDVHGASAILRVLSEDDGCLIITIKFGGSRLRMSQFLVEGSEPHEMLSSVAKSDVFQLSG